MSFESFDEIPDNEIGSAAALITRKIDGQTQILALARGGDRNRLGLIAGSRDRKENSDDFAETPRECIARELLEELTTDELVGGVQANNFKISEKPIYVEKPKSDHPYCATYLVEYEGPRIDIFPVILFQEDGITKIEGFAEWVSPQELISNTKSAFLEYNTHLLQKAEIIN